MNWDLILFDPTIFSSHLLSWFAALLGYDAANLRVGMLTPYFFLLLALMIAGSILVMIRRMTHGSSDRVRGGDFAPGQSQIQNWRGD
jgi:hypothetical protein